jgi:hypothetical protein
MNFTTTRSQPMPSPQSFNNASAQLSTKSSSSVRDSRPDQTRYTFSAILHASSHSYCLYMAHAQSRYAEQSTSLIRENGKTSGKY